jgi:hypothetical protein
MAGQSLVTEDDGQVERSRDVGGPGPRRACLEPFPTVEVERQPDHELSHPILVDYGAERSDVGFDVPATSECDERERSSIDVRDGEPDATVAEVYPQDAAHEGGDAAGSGDSIGPASPTTTSTRKA